MLKETAELQEAVLKTLNDMKAQDITILDVHDLTSICDIMIIVSGSSARHVKSMATALITTTKSLKHSPISIEGEKQADWVLADLGDIVVHIMKPEVREFYQLEKLWSVPNMA